MLDLNYAVGAASRSASRVDGRPRWSASTTRRSGSPTCSREIGCRGRPATATSARRDAAELAARPADPADLAEEVIRLDGYDKVPSALPIAPPGNGSDARPSAGAARSAGRWPRPGYVEVLLYPFVVAEALPTRSGSGRRPAPAGVRLANPLSDEEPLHADDACCRRCSRRCGATSAGASATWPCSSMGLVFQPVGDGAAARRWGSTSRPTDERVRRGRRPRCRASRGTSPRCWPARPSRPAGGVPGRAAGWADAVAGARGSSRGRGGAGGDRSSGRRPMAPWHPGRCAAIVRRRRSSSGTPASCIPPCARRWTCPGARARWS